MNRGGRHLFFEFAGIVWELKGWCGKNKRTAAPRGLRDWNGLWGVEGGLLAWLWDRNGLWGLGVRQGTYLSALGPWLVAISATCTGGKNPACTVRAQPHPGGAGDKGGHRRVQGG